MSNPLSRYRMLYKKVPRPNSITPFPKHVFMRSQNQFQHMGERLGGQEDCLDTTFVHLTERFNDRELFLVGSMNSSTMLARRTRKLIQEVKPDAVMVMTSPEWWDSARLIEGVHSQEDFDMYYNEVLKNIDDFDVDTSWFRGSVFWIRILLMKIFLKMTYLPGSHFRFYEPGLEIKYACEEAEKLGAELHFLGAEMNNITWHRLYHDTKFTILSTIKRMNEFGGSRWAVEAMDNLKKMQMTTPSQFTEVCCDSYTINWYIKNLELNFPSLKNILVDKRDMALYKYITRKTKGKRILAVVNQWHMEGIEHLWAHEFGQLPRSQKIIEEIDPIGDMNLHKGLFDVLYNALHRKIKTAHSNTTPSSYSNMMNTYHREQNWQYEHRNM